MSDGNDRGGAAPTDHEETAERDALTLSDAEQMASDAEQMASEVDQTAADGDQTSADEDALASDSDQSRADRDQEASDRDQVAADRDQRPRGEPEAGGDYEASRLERLEGTLERDESAAIRHRGATERDWRGDRRDELARTRDLAAEARDRAAEARDIASAEIEGSADGFFHADDESYERLAEERQRVVETRVLAAADRERAARDREDAARNRREGAEDREQAGRDRHHASIDELTGVYSRSIGLLSLAHEIERSRRSEKPLCVAFIDVDDLKAVNAAGGHAAGDELLRRVGSALRAELRPYDSIVRMGGDEFACAISDSDPAVTRRRLERIASSLAGGGYGPSFSFGLIEVGPEESTADALARADEAMRESKAARQAPRV